MTTMVRWDPFRDVATLTDRLNRMFNENPGLLRTGESYGAWTPPVDIFEKADNLVLRAELPGMKKDDIDVRIENGVLTLHGERRQDTDIEEDNVHRIERVYGSFTRSFALPTTVEASKIQASYKDGILEVLLPKSETSKPKRIEIQAH